MTDVLIAGVGMIPFTKPGQGQTYDLMGATAAGAALEDAGVVYANVQRAYAGYVYGDSCAGQAALGHLGATGIPIVNVNNNCASGSTAFALAVEAVRNEPDACVLALGFEQMAPGALDVVFGDRPTPVGPHLSRVAEMMSLSTNDRTRPPAIQLFGCQVELLQNQCGVGDRALAKIAVKARRHAAANSHALFRTPLQEDEVLASPLLFRGLRKLFACPPSCGAAAAVLCGPRFAARHGLPTNVRVIGSGWTSDRSEHFAGNPLDLMFRALGKDAADKAYETAGVGPKDIDVVELHDCFTSNEALMYSALGFCSDGEIERFILEGRGSYGGDIVVNPSGGLLSKGHPLGATGLAQIAELTWQLRGRAGPRQVEGARIGLQQNAGLGSAGFVHILQNG
ncbi:lipid-transfer protein [Bradyrhizobium sp. INPA03-11B]|uniref:thiolase C-terminal domain-containing protein n=1 Tax=Bradyrhizobium sp. INPA03-11B TaxID=418598 RepID=UPI003390183E